MNYEYSSDLHKQIVSIIRADLAEDAAQGFPLLKSFPNSETASTPDYFASLSGPDQEALLDGLAYFALLPFAHELVEQKKSDPVMGPFLNKQPNYGQNYLVGRPSKSKIKKQLTDRLSKAGFTYKTNGSLIFFRGSGSTKATLRINLDPGLKRQLDYRLSDWMDQTIVDELEPLSVRWADIYENERTHIAPIIGGLSYDHIWTATQGASTANCWDLITEENLEQTVELLPTILKRLGTLTESINALA